jgi:enterochelin esterase family protein
MPSPFPHLPPYERGRVRILDHASRLLGQNPWGDPAHRDLCVYTPPGYDQDPSRRYPAILVLAPYASTGEGLLARGMSDLPLSARIDRLIQQGCPPFIAVLPDSMSRLGGTQHMDSSGIGPYGSWLCDELMPFVDGRFRTTGRWAALGRSSGGYGALHLAMERPGRFAALACHAGDMGFDLAYLADIPGGLPSIRAAGGPRAMVERFWSSERPSGGDFAALNLLCMSAAYALPGEVEPDGFPGRLPVDWQSGELRWEVLQAWLRFDPVRRAADPQACQALAQLELLFLDAGDRDEHFLQLGARRFCAALRQAGLAPIYEEFPGGHRGTAFRYDRSIPLLARALGA